MNPQKSTREKLYFDAIKEDRGSYFVEYQPPISDNPFATLNIVYPESYNIDSVAETMKAEVAHWMARYPVRIMAWAWDSAENHIEPHGKTDDGVLLGWFRPGTNTIDYAWKVEGLPPFLNDTSNLPDWRTIYGNVPFRTDAEVKANADREFKKIRIRNLTLKLILVGWFAVIPAAWAVVQYLGPNWLAIAVTLYGLWQAFRTARKLLWHVEPSRSEKEKAEKELKMRHYFWHCERNPKGFSRLKAENFEREARNRTRKELDSLRGSLGSE